MRRACSRGSPEPFALTAGMSFAGSDTGGIWGMHQREEPDSIAETLKSLDEAIGEFHAIKDSLQRTSAGHWSSSMAEAGEQIQAVEQSQAPVPD